MSEQPPEPGPEAPEWLETYKKRTALIDVIAMAFDTSISDKEVREALVEVSKQLGDMFQPGGAPPG